MNTILNISAYKFVTLPDAPALRDTLLQRALDRQLKGTILLAEEGINLFLAGPAAAVRGFVAQLREDARFADLAPKESWSDTQPFRKMLVKVKRGDHPHEPPGDPARCRRPAARRRWTPPRSSAGWTRAMTTPAARWSRWTPATPSRWTTARFDGAIDWRIDKFTEFPQALLRPHGTNCEDKTVVSFCTGGIRCEKAAHPACAKPGWSMSASSKAASSSTSRRPAARTISGGCFVFDERRALDSGLSTIKT